MNFKLLLNNFILINSLIISSNSFASIDKSHQKLITILETIRVKKNVPAFSFVVVNRNSIVISASSGVENRVGKKKMSIDSIIRIGSITKTFTALAILKLEQLKKLLLTDPIKIYIDDLPLINQWHKTNPVKIVHLLEHTSGLLDLSKAEFSFNDDSIKSIKKAFSFAPQNRIIKWPPGLHSSYSNVGAGYLGYIIEKTSGKNYETYVSTSILKPLNMFNSSFFLDTKTAQNLATGYDIDGKTVIPYWHMIFRPFGALNSSTREMASLVRLFLNDGKINNIQLLTKKNIRRMEIPKSTLASKTGLQFGYGLANYSHLHNGTVFHGHGGDGDGYLAYYSYSRENSLGYFIVINAFNNSALYQMRMVLEDYITGSRAGQKSNKKLNDLNYSHATLKQFVGDYKQITYRMPWQANTKTNIKITLDNNKLYSLIDHVKKQLIPVNKYQFRLKNQTVATQAFISYYGELFYQNSSGNYKRIKN